MIPVYLLSPAGKLLHRVQALSASFSRKIDDVGTFSLTCEIPPDIGPDYRIKLDFPGESDVIWLVEDTEDVILGNRRLLSVTGSDGKLMYEKRFVFAYGDTAEGYKIDYPARICSDLINEQMVTPVLGGSIRTLYGLIEAVPPEGVLSGATAWEGEVCWRKLWDVFKEQMEFGRATGLPFFVDLVAESSDGPGLVPIIGRRPGVERRLTSVQLNQFGISVRRVMRSSDNAETVFALGSGEGSLALYSKYPSTILDYYPQADPFWYKEDILTQGNEDDLDALAKAATAAYQEHKTRTVLVVENGAPVENFWGTLIGYGDLVTVEHYGIEQTVTVTAYTLEWDAGGEPSVSFALEEGY